jgi:hypothetical protein
MELTPAEKRKWIDPLIFENEEDVNAFIDTLEAAAAYQKKEINIKYKNITDKNEIKKMFGVDNNEKK